MKKLLPLFIMILVSTVFLSACSPEPPTEATDPIGESDVLMEGLIAQGHLEPVNRLDQAFSMSGKVAEVMARDGELVAEGQLLARLVHLPEAETALARSKQELLAAEQELDRLKKSASAALADAKLARIAAQEAHNKAIDRYEADDTKENEALLDKAGADLYAAIDRLRILEQHKGIDPDQLASVEARLAAANAGLASAQDALDAVEMRSTVAGTVIDLTLQAGQQVSAGSPVLTVADYSAWVLKTDNLSESEVVNVEVGQPVIVVADALPDMLLAGEVTHINARFEEKRGDITYTATVMLKETDPRLRWGMTAVVRFGN